MEYKEFQEKIPYDPGDIFWSHITILRKDKTVSVNVKNAEVSNSSSNNANNVKVIEKPKITAPVTVANKPVFMKYPTRPPG